MTASGRFTVEKNWALSSPKQTRKKARQLLGKASILCLKVETVHCAKDSLFVALLLW